MQDSSCSIHSYEYTLFIILRFSVSGLVLANDRRTYGKLAALLVSNSLVHKDIAMRRHSCKLYNSENSYKTLIITEKCDYLRVIYFKKNLEEERKL